MLFGITVVASIIFFVHIVWIFICWLSKGNNYNQNIRIIEGRQVGSDTGQNRFLLIDENYNMDTTTLVNPVIRDVTATGKAFTGQVTSSLSNVYVEFYDMQTGTQHYMNLEKELILGRQLAGDIIKESFLNDATVSQKHFRIYRQGEQIFLQDLGSKNHTWLNGCLVEGTMPLSFGDRIQVGKTTLRFQCYR